MKQSIGNRPGHGDDKDNHWLVRPTTIKLLWRGFAVVLALTVLAQLVISIKGYFGADGWFGFAALFGFVSCLLMVLFAKGLGLLLKRPDAYYQSNESDGDQYD